ncbi:hypothetical protein DXV76_16060 [Rhodobacteraceae bacterium CCMM004]|nr:hypothetical protein DXV76_16060 [Rhodobacteraceae bacterium CCMM004]
MTRASGHPTGRRPFILAEIPRGRPQAGGGAPKRRLPLLLAATLPLLAACMPMTPKVNAPGAPQVRYFASTESAGDGARWHIFLYDPAVPRSLDERIDLARAAVAQDRGCRWVGADRDALAERTRAQGARYGETVLAAPLRCTA